MRARTQQAEREGRKSRILLHHTQHQLGATFMSPSAVFLLVALGAALAEATTVSPAFAAPPVGPSGRTTEGRRTPGDGRGAGAGGPGTSIKSLSAWLSACGGAGALQQQQEQQQHGEGVGRGLQEQQQHGEGVGRGLRRRRTHDVPAASRITSIPSEPSRHTPLAHLRMASAGIDRRTASLPPLRPRRAFEAAACFRGGGSSDSGDRDSVVSGLRPAIAAAVKGVGAGKNKRSTRLIIDHVEDALSCVWESFVVPMFHVTRLGFGLSLLFYGMAFRTFAFHVIVFRIAGFKQLQRALSQLASKYGEARQSVREAAAAAETVGERVIKGDEIKAAREKMIKEKKRLLSDGILTEQETRYFMKKYSSELSQIKEEQEQFQSARSSVMSVRKSVDPKQARSSIAGVYSAMVACFTASTVQTAGQITLGLHVGSLLKTHVLDLFGPIFDPIGYRLDLNTYYDKEDIPYMGKANAMGGPQNMALNIVCYSVVFAVFRVHPSVALKASMVYYGARVVTDYVIWCSEPARRKLGQMTIIHTPWSAVIHAGLTGLGFYYHRNVLHTAGIPGLHPLAVGPGIVGLVEPCVRFFVAISGILARIDFFSCRFIDDPVEAVKNIASKR